MQLMQKIEELRLHTLGRVVWFREPGQRAQMSPLPPEEFVRQQIVLTAESVRLLWSVDNTRLITGLHTSRCAGKQSGNVRMGNPTWMPTGEVDDVDHIFNLMDGHEEAPSVGGWRQLTEKDYVTAALVSEFIAADRKCTPLVERFLRVHPAWPALSFLQDLSKVAACELILKIGDPRWYVDPKFPNRLSKLRSLLGAGDEGMSNIRKFLQDPAGFKETPLKLLLDTWTGGEYSPPPQDMVGPASFLWRVYHNVAAEYDGYRAMLRACHAFLRFLSSVWLDNLTDARKYKPVVKKTRSAASSLATSMYPVMEPCRNYSPTLFVPQHFFRLGSEVEAWRQHVEKCQGHVS